MAFSRVSLKNEIEALSTLVSQLSSINDAVNILKSKTLDGSRAVYFEGLNVVHTGPSPQTVPLFKLKVAGAIFLTAKGISGDKDACVMAKHPTKSQFYTLCGHATVDGGADLIGMKTPILKPDVRVFMRKTGASGDNDQVNYFPIFVPTLSSVGNTITDFTERLQGQTQETNETLTCTTNDIRDILM